MTIIDEAIKNSKEIIELRRFFHENPEPGFREEKTAERIEKELERIGGFEVRRVAGTGVVADIGESLSRIMLRADMDALELEEKTDASYASKNQGLMHACGHDAHMAMLLGAAKIIASKKKDLKRGVRIIFQPSEETAPGGAQAMISEGVLDGVTAAFAQHVYPQLSAGAIGVKSGVMMAASDDFDVAFIGREGHAAFPNDCRDSIVAGAEFVSRIQTLISRRVSPFDSAVLTIGSFYAGTRRNIIAGEARIQGTIRTLNQETGELLRRQVEQIARSSATALETGIEFKLIESYPILENDIELTDCVKRTAADILGEKNVIEIKHPSMGSEDFAYYGGKVPICFFRLGSGGEESSTRFCHHNSKFNIDESCLPIGAALMASLVFE